MTGATDCASTMRALGKGESAITFEAALTDSIVDVEGMATWTTTKHVAAALQAVTMTEFPYCALEMQHQ